MNQLVVCLLILSLSNCPVNDRSQPDAGTSEHRKSATAGSEARGVVETHESISDPDPPRDKDSLYIIADLDDGSRVIGTSKRTAFPLVTRYAKLEIPMTMVQTIEFVDSQTNVILHTRSGDRLEGALNLDMIELETVFGRASIQLAKVVFISVQREPGLSFGGLVLYYPFEGNANDKSGNGHDGILHGATLTSDRSGKAQSAFDFDGLHDGIIVSHSSAWPVQQQLTLCGWVCPRDFYPGRCQANDMIHRGRTDNESGMFALRYMDCDDDCDEFSPSTERFGFNLYLNGLGQVVVGTTIVHPNNWYFVAGTYDGMSMKLYVNGALENTLPASGVMSRGRGDVTIGYNEDHQFPYRVNGVLDEIRIYSRALTQREIQTLYHTR